LTMMEEHLQKLQNKTITEYSDLLHNIPFWIENKKEHQYYYEKCKFHGNPGFCCFSHTVGMPYKEGLGRLPWFDYQLDFVNAHASHKLLRVIKATGLGFSEICLYLIGSIATFPAHRTKRCEIPILTGPNVDISKKLIKRLYNILTTRLPQLANELQATQTTIEINNCTIEAFPSHHIDAVRALPYPVYILLDEADFFPYEFDDPNSPVKVVERYIPKSNPWIVLVSTPNLPGGLYERLDNDPQSRYHTFRFNYEWGLGKIYDLAQIEEAKKSPSFEREYNLKYGAGIGNIFNEVWIGMALLKGQRLKEVPISYHTPKTMGLDPAWGSSKFGITKIEYLKYTQIPELNNTKRVYYSKGFEREQYEEMLDLCYRFIKEDNISYIFVDGSQVEFIRSLKAKIGEDPDFETVMERAKKYDTLLSDYMTVIPILNQQYGKKVIDDAKYWLGRSKTVSIDEENATELVKQMHFAKQKETGVLNKDPTMTKVAGTMDELESFLYAMQYFTHS
jgi:hypothetical protein